PSHANTTAAEVQARDAIKLHADRVDAYAIIGQVYADRGLWNELEAILADAARAVPDDLSPYYCAAERLVATGRDPERAARHLRIYLAQEPEGNAPTAAEAKHLLKRLRATM